MDLKEKFEQLKNKTTVLTNEIIEIKDEDFSTEISELEREQAKLKNDIEDLKKCLSENLNQKILTLLQQQNRESEQIKDAAKTTSHCQEIHDYSKMFPIKTLKDLYAMEELINDHNIKELVNVVQQLLVPQGIINSIESVLSIDCIMLCNLYGHRHKRRFLLNQMKFMNLLYRAVYYDGYSQELFLHEIRNGLKMATYRYNRNRRLLRRQALKQNNQNPGKPPETENISEYTKMFPIKTLKDLDTMEELISENNIDELVSVVKKLLAPQGIVKNIASVLSIKCILACNVDGEHHKRRLLDQKKFMDLLFRAAYYEGCSHKHFLLKVRRSLNLAKNRYYQRRRRLSQRLIIEQAEEEQDEEMSDNLAEFSAKELQEEFAVKGREQDKMLTDNLEEFIKIEQEQVEEETHNLEEPIETEKNCKYSNIFPIKTLKDLNALEVLINDNNIDELVTVLQQLLVPGGIIKNIESILSIECITDCNLDGHVGQTALSTQKKFMDLLFRAASYDGYSRKKFSEEIRRGLSLAKRRHYEHYRRLRLSQHQEEKEQEKEITTDNLKKFAEAEKNQDDEMCNYFKMFPIQTLEDLDAMEELITENNFEELVTVVKQLLDPEGITKNITSILSINCVLACNLSGVHKKKRLLDLKKFMDLFYRAASYDGSSKKKFYEQVRRGLDLAKRRHYEHCRRSRLSQRHIMEEAEEEQDEVMLDNMKELTAKEKVQGDEIAANVEEFTENDREPDEEITDNLKEFIKIEKEQVEENTLNLGKLIKTESLCKYTKMFPIKTLKDLDAMEELINDNNIDEMVTVVQQLLVPDGIIKHIDSVLSVECIMACNLDGNHRKRALLNQKKFMDLFFRAAHYDGYSHKLFLEEIRRGLNLVKRRHNEHIRRTRLAQCQNMEQEHDERVADNLKEFITTEVNQDEEMCKYSKMFPIKTLKDLDAMEELINDDNITELVTVVQQLLGPQGITQNLASVLSIECIWACNIYGHRHKKALLDQKKFMDLLFRSIYYEGYSQKLFLEELRQGLKVVKNRHDQYLRRCRQSQRQAMEEEEEDEKQIEISNYLEEYIKTGEEQVEEKTYNMGKLIETGKICKYSKMFPIKTLKDLDAMEELINDNNIDELVTVVQLLLAPQGIAKNILSVLSTECVMACSLDGNQNKRRLLDQNKLMDILFRATYYDGYSQPLFLQEVRRGLDLVKRRHNEYLRRRRLIQRQIMEEKEVEKDQYKEINDNLEDFTETECDQYGETIDNLDKFTENERDQDIEITDDLKECQKTHNLEDLKKTENVCKYYKMFPIKSLKDLDAMEELINDENINELVTVVQLLLAPHGIVKNIDSVLSVECIMACNLDGIHHKRRLLNQKKFMDLLFRAAYCDGYSQELFVNQLRRGLSLVKRRYNEYLRRRRLMQRQIMEEDDQQNEKITNNTKKIVEKERNQSEERSDELKKFMEKVKDEEITNNVKELLNKEEGQVKKITHNLRELMCKYSNLFPIKRIKDLEAMEELINHNNIDELVIVVQQLLGPGGIINNLASILSTKLILACDLDSEHCKRRFWNQKKFMNLLFLSVSYEGYSQKQFLEEVREGLKVAKNRHKSYLQRQHQLQRRIVEEMEKDQVKEINNNLKDFTEKEWDQDEKTIDNLDKITEEEGDQNIEITDNLKECRKSVNEITHNLEGFKETENICKYSKMFPIKSLKDLDAMEELINDKNINDLVTVVKLLLAPHGIVKNIDSVLSVECIMACNLDGMHRKRRLLNQKNFVDLLFRAAYCNGYSQELFVNELRRGLNLVKRRHNQYLRRLRLTQSQIIEDEKEQEDRPTNNLLKSTEIKIEQDEDMIDNLEEFIKTEEEQDVEINHNLEEHTEMVSKYSKMFPIKTLKDLDAMEKLINENNIDELVTGVKNLLGTQGIVKNIASVLSTKFIMACNSDDFLHRRRLFNQTSFMDLLFRSVYYDGYSQEMFVEEIHRGFNLVRSRYNNSIRRRRLS